MAKSREAISSSYRSLVEVSLFISWLCLQIAISLVYLGLLELIHQCESRTFTCWRDLDPLQCLNLRVNLYSIPIVNDRLLHIYLFSVANLKDDSCFTRVSSKLRACKFKERLAQNQT